MVIPACRVFCSESYSLIPDNCGMAGQADVPKLFAQLPDAVPLADIRLIDPAEEGQEGTAAEQLYRYMHDALEQVGCFPSTPHAVVGQPPAELVSRACARHCLWPRSGSHMTTALQEVPAT